MYFNMPRGLQNEFAVFFSQIIGGERTLFVWNNCVQAGVIFRLYFWSGYIFKRTGSTYNGFNAVC